MQLRPLFQILGSPVQNRPRTFIAIGAIGAALLITPVGAQTPPAPQRSGSAVDHVAAASAVPILAIGVSQLVSPFFASPFTGFESGPSSVVIALQWIVFRC